MTNPLFPSEKYFCRVCSYDRILQGKNPKDTPLQVFLQNPSAYVLGHDLSHLPDRILQQVSEV